MKLQLTDITIKQGRRAVDESKVRELAQSMSEVGLINPITVTRNKTLITGAHRLAAAKLLGWSEIEATVSELDGLRAELAEIDENLMRNELHYIDRGQAFKRRDELLTEAGMRRKDGRHPNYAESAQLKTTQDIADDLGVSRRVLLEEKQIATNILPEVQDTIKEVDLPKRDALKIARMEPEQQVKVAEKLNEGARSFNDAQRLIRRETVQATPPLEGKYQVIYADPPWQYDNSGFNSSAEQHYPTMSMDELKALDVKSIRAENAVLFMWATNPLLKEAIDLMASWGFEYKTNMAWVKDRQINLGFYVYGKHELLLIGTTGSMLPIGEKPSSVMTGSNNIHSKKPESTYETIEAMYPGLRYIELFARNEQRTGWVKWGNEVGKYD